jgi:hypothetical protein
LREAATAAPDEKAAIDYYAIDYYKKAAALGRDDAADARLLAQARNPYTRSWLWIPGSRFARPE